QELREAFHKLKDIATIIFNYISEGDFRDPKERNKALEAKKIEACRYCSYRILCRTKYFLT
ncbi:MAG: hypothetical protein SNJ78_10620, partial [Spirochaetales bacterium]